MGRGPEPIEKKRTDRIKTLKNEEKEKRRIQGKSNNNNKYFWFYLLDKKSYFAQKHSLTKSSLYHHHILFIVFMCSKTVPITGMGHDGKVTSDKKMIFISYQRNKGGNRAIFL